MYILIIVGVVVDWVGIRARTMMMMIHHNYISAIIVIIYLQLDSL